MEIRTGIGFDAHKFKNISEKEENVVFLGGIAIKCKFTIEAHSDGDVLLHAITDAIFGSISDGDIGIHFPPSDPKWKNASSKKFLEFAHERVRMKLGEIVNIDSVIICEEPKIFPYRIQIIENIAKILSIEADRISVKATTTEKMGFTGRKEGIAVQAIATIKLNR